MRGAPSNEWTIEASGCVKGVGAKGRERMREKYTCEAEAL
jgi:hypothetical protein